MSNAIQGETLDLPINKEICFSTHKGKFKERIMKRQLKLLKKFTPLLKQFLEPDEVILLAVKATSPMSFLEQFTTGWIIYYIKRCVLIFTNKRILHLPTRANYSPKKSIAQIRYGDIEKFKLSGFLGRILNLEYKSGKKEKFYHIASAEIKKLKNFFPQTAKGTQPSKSKERNHLCPKCTAALKKEIFSCPNCRLEFKNAKQATVLSIVFPGGGYFYTRHPIMGIGDAMVETILLIAVIASAINAYGGAEPWAGVIFIAIVLFLEKIMTIYHARHYVSEYIPTDENFMPLRK